MDFLKKFARGLLALLLKFSLVALALSASLFIVFGSSTELKQALNNSGIYTTFVDNALDTASKENSPKIHEVPLDQPEIRSAAKATFPPQFLQFVSEQVIDGTYRWLGGTSPSPDFRIDLAPAKQNFITALGDYAVRRAQSLPPCTLQQLRELQGQGSIDPFNAPCVPPGFAVNGLRDQVIVQLNKSDSEFLKNPLISVDNLPKDGQGRTVFQNLEGVPEIFHWLGLAPYIFGGLAIISALGIVFLHDEKRRGLRHIGVSLLGTSVFLFVNIWLLTYIFTRLNQPDGPIGRLARDKSQQVLLDVSNSLVSTLNQKGSSLAKPT